MLFMIAVYMVTVAGPSPKVILKGKGLKEAELDKVATFTIDGREAGQGMLRSSCSKELYLLICIHSEAWVIFCF